MPDDKAFGVVFDSMMKEAVAANFRAKMAAMPSEDEILREYPLSDKHSHTMDAMFKAVRRQTVKRKLFASAKTAAIIICVVSTIAFALVMANPEVRAAVRNAIVSFFDGFTRVEFEEPHDKEREAQHFAPNYIPQGYELTHQEVYGLNCVTVYEDDSGNMLMLDVGPPDAANVDNDHHIYYSETYDGVTYHINTALNEDRFTTIIWTSNGFSFEILGTLAVEELLQMARLVEYYE